ncbi:hypothetical protein HWV62_3863 [Athelia sp. TMB]|nr:hypothetical protein HWV62_3863 [Athelia sp. TMB]
MHWNALTQVRYNFLADSSWSTKNFVARPLSRPWHGKLRPTLAVSPTRLLVAAGHTIYSYKFSSASGSFESPGVHLEISYTVAAPFEGGRRDITAIAFVPDQGADRTIVVGFNDGSMDYISLPHPNNQKHGHEIMHPSSNAFDFDAGNVIESLSTEGDLLLSLSSGGFAGLTNTKIMAPPSHAILQARGWSTFLSTKSSTPYAAFGVSSKTPLSIYSITESTLQSTPSAILGTNKPHAVTQKPSAVYGISGVPASSPWGGSNQIVISGWYDGIVRVHDLRSAGRRVTAGGTSLLPVISLKDTWSLEPIYSVACGGGSSSHIAAGSARHSVVAFWDVRAPSRGWSVHAPGNDSSPVYSIHLESSRLFGATQSRSFVYDFGPGVTQQTYPDIPPAPRGDDGLKPKRRGSIGYYVTQYYHSRD